MHFTSKVSVAETLQVRLIQNEYSSDTDVFTWSDAGIVFPEGACTNKYGVGIFDLAVRFAGT